MKSHRSLSPRQEAAAERALFQAVLTLRSMWKDRAGDPSTARLLVATLLGPSPNS